MLINTGRILDTCITFNPTKLLVHAINTFTHGELNAKSKMFSFCPILKCARVPMKLDNKLLLNQKSNPTKFLN